MRFRDIYTRFATYIRMKEHATVEELATDYFTDICTRNVICRRLVIMEQVPGRLERLINKAGLSVLHLHGISRPNVFSLSLSLSFSFSHFKESDISMADRALIKFSTCRILEFGKKRDPTSRLRTREEWKGMERNACAR